MKIPVVVLFALLMVCGVCAECIEPPQPVVVDAAMDYAPKLPMACVPVHVWVDGILAPVGTEITCSGENVYQPGEKYTLSATGGSRWELTGKKMIIQGTPANGGQIPIPENAPISFYVNGVVAQVRIYKDTGIFSGVNTDGVWFDTIPWKTGGTYEIELNVGTIVPTPIPTPVQSEPCDAWDRNNVKWTDEDMYWIQKWRSDPETEWIARELELLATDWYVPDYNPNWAAINDSDDKYTFLRIIEFAESGGYGFTPNLTAMIEAQNWKILHTSYGWPYDIGAPSPTKWGRLSASVSGYYGMPSLYVPPVTEVSTPTPVTVVPPVVVESEPVPTLTPQAPITRWSNDGTVCFVLVWDTHIEKYVWARALLS